MVRWIVMVLGFTTLVAAGCQQGDVGSRPHDVFLISNPNGATPYIIELDALNAERQRRQAAQMPADDMAIMADEEFLREFRVKNGVLMGCEKSPGHTMYPGFNHVLIAKMGGYQPVMSQIFTPPRTIRVRLMLVESDRSIGR